MGGKVIIGMGGIGRDNVCASCKLIKAEWRLLSPPSLDKCSEMKEPKDAQCHKSQVLLNVNWFRAVFHSLFFHVIFLPQHLLLSGHESHANMQKSELHGVDN